MFKRVFQLLSFMLCLVQLQAQKKFPGFYIDLKGDTVNGNFLNYKDKEDNPETIKFEAAGGNTIELTPKNSLGLHLEGYDTYESRSIKRMKNAIEFKPGINETDPTDVFEQKDVFLTVLFDQDGTRLYGFRDRLRVNFFIQKNSDTLTELQFKMYLNNNVLVEERKYRNQLNFLFLSAISTDNKLKEIVEKLNYDENDLVSFLHRIYDKKWTKDKNKYPLDIEILGGASSNKFEIDGPKASIYGPARTIFKNSIGPVVGISLNKYSRKNFGKNFLSVQLKYWSFKNSGSVNGTDAYDVNYKAGVIALGVAVGRNWIHKPNISWSTSISAGNTIVVGGKAESAFTHLVYKAKNSSLGLYSSLQTSVVVMKRLSIWGAYYLNAINSHVYPFGTAYEAYHTPSQVGLGWRFKTR